MWVKEGFVDQRPDVLALVKAWCSWSLKQSKEAGVASVSQGREKLEGVLTWT